MKISETKTSPMLSLIWNNFPSNGKVLDLGCGQGADLLFLAKNGFNTFGVDTSEVAIQQIMSKAGELGLNNVKVERTDIREYKTEPDSFDVISCQNVLNFLPKEDALKMIDIIKSGTKKDGYILIQVFTVDDPSINSDNKFASYFEIQELLHLFEGFRVYHYLENIILDQGHPGYKIPHKHGIARIIVKK